MRHRFRRLAIQGALAAHLPAVFLARGAGSQRQSRDRQQARQGLAAETERAHALEVLEAGDLAGGVALQCQRELAARDAVPVVAHPDQGQAAQFQLEVDAPGARVEAVLEQLLDRGGRPLNHFAGGDLVDELFWEDLDAPRHAARFYFSAGTASPPA
jgi:hypothetical protein